MSPVLLAASDCIESEFDPEIYKNLSPLEKYQSLLFSAIDKLFSFLGTDRKSIAPFLTDFVSIEAQSLGREGYGFALRDANDLGLAGLACHVVDLGGASVGGALHQARTIVLANPEAVVLVAAGDVPKSVFRQVSDLKRLTATVCHPNWEMPYGATLIGLYSLLCEKLMHETGISISNLEEITKYFRSLSQNNPRAFQFEKPIIEKQLKKPLAGVYSSPMIAIVTDHAFATLIMSELKKEELIQKGILPKETSHVYLAGSGQSAHAEYFIQKKGLQSPASVAFERALSSSGFGSEAVDYAWIYDCFTGMIIHQASEYFGVSPKEVALSLEKGTIPTGKKSIPINLGGGILNYQAAMSLSGATGLIDITSQYKLCANPIPNCLKEIPSVSVLGGNGGIDSINSVVIFSQNPPSKDSKPRHSVPKHLEVNEPKTKAGDQGTIVTATPVYFNPGGEKKPPYLLVVSQTEDSTLILSNLFQKDGTEVKEITNLDFGKTKVTFQSIEGQIQAVVLE